MKKRTKGILAFAFLGGIMLTSTVMIAVPGGEVDNAGISPEEHFEPDVRDQFCGFGEAGSNRYIKEYHIPSRCTQPLALTVDSSGMVWFAGSNTGNITRFDPGTERFTEFANPQWPAGARSMMWGMDYSADDSIWYTDEAIDSIWRFDIGTEEYQRLNYPRVNDISLPQRLEIDGSQMIINDLHGNKLTVLDVNVHEAENMVVNIPSPVTGSVTGAFAKDSEDNLWFTNWIPERDGVLIKMDYQRFIADVSVDSQRPLGAYVQTFPIPIRPVAINGIAVDQDDNVWMADTISSNVYKFVQEEGRFYKYFTSPVPESAYGNQTGVVLSEPLSRPYWMGVMDDGRIVFNEQTANRIALFNGTSETLVEYSVPTKNPRWSDCGDVKDCGLAQVFDFEIAGDKIWFTEWAANNIGVLDTGIEPEIDMRLNTRTVFHNSDLTARMTITATEDTLVNIISDDDAGMVNFVAIPDTFTLAAGESRTVTLATVAAEDTEPGTYHAIVGAQAGDIAISQYVTVLISS